jgi:hypothetical protein
VESAPPKSQQMPLLPKLLDVPSVTSMVVEAPSQADQETSA